MLIFLFFVLTGTTTNGSFRAPAGTTLFPAFSVLNETVSTPAGLIARLGKGTKSVSNPLFGQTLPWEPRIDNGYANVIFDSGYSKSHPWRLWYDSFTSCNDAERDDRMRYLHCGGGKRHHSGLYAESKDGLVWEKPELDSGVTYLAGTGFCCDLKVCECKPGTPGAVKTNIYTMEANGNTVYKDEQPGIKPEEKYKVFGNNLPGNFVNKSSKLPDFGNVGGICVSPDGLTFDPSFCSWLNISHSHWDTWSTLFWDEKSASYLANMRSDSSMYNPCGDRFYPSCIGSKLPGCDMAACIHSTRDVSRIQSLHGDWTTIGQANGGSVPMLRARDGGAQLYELVGFKYYGVYLAILDVYYAAGARQEVHCELAWSSDFQNWHRIEEGRDLVPLGAEGSFESHICYGSVPVEVQGGNVDSDSSGGGGVTDNGSSTHSSGPASTSMHSGGPPSTSTSTSNSIREYYFGGDGPHFGTRNSSLAVVTFREAGLAGVGAKAGWNTAVWGETIQLTITGTQLLVTADTDTLLGGGENTQGSSTLDIVGKLSLSVRIVGLANGDNGDNDDTVANPTGDRNGNAGRGGSVVVCSALEKANVTNAAMNGCDLSPYLGQNATVQITLDGAAMLYMLGFGNSSSG